MRQKRQPSEYISCGSLNYEARAGGGGTGGEGEQWEEKQKEVDKVYEGVEEKEREEALWKKQKENFGGELGRKG